MIGYGLILLTIISVLIMLTSVSVLIMLTSNCVLVLLTGVFVVLLMLFWSIMMLECIEKILFTIGSIIEWYGFISVSAISRISKIS